MGKTGKFWVVNNIIFLIILVIFDVLFIVLRSDGYKLSAWISFAFAHFAFFMVTITPLLVTRKRKLLSFELPLNLALSGIYFSLAIIVASFFVIASVDTPSTIEIVRLYWKFIPPNLQIIGILAETLLRSPVFALMSQLVIAGLYGILLLVNVVANKQTAEALEKRQVQIDYIKVASTKLKMILDRVEEKETKKIVEKAYDAVYSSPVKSHPSIEHMESGIVNCIDELGSEVSAGNKEKIIFLANSLLTTVNERNLQLKSLNR